MKLSVVVCLYNEEENVNPLLLNLEKALTGITSEVIMVNDGSTDRTAQYIGQYAKPWVKLIRLKKNYGQSSALAAGIEYAKGEYIVTMDGDLQNDATDIPMLLSVIESGEYDIVAGYRENREDNYISRKLPSMIANMLIRKSTGISIRDYGCTLRIMSSPVAKDLKLYGELHRFIPVLASLDGATRIAQVSVKHHTRKFGQSKYTINRTLKVVSDLLLMLFFKKYMQKPMHLFGSVGVLMILAGGVINLYMLWQKLTEHDIWGKPILLLGMILLLAGIQIITTGLMLEMQMRTYYESQGKKPYQIRSIKSFENISFENKSQKIPASHSKVVG